MKRLTESLSRGEGIDLWVMMAFFGLLVSVIGLTGYSTFSYQKSGIKRQLQENLATVADLKVGQINTWLAERRNDAMVMGSDPLWGRTISFDLESASETRREIGRRFQNIRKMYGVRDVFILKPSGDLWISSRELPPVVSTMTQAIGRAVCESGLATYSQLMLMMEGDSPVLEFEVFAPILHPGNGHAEPFGVLVFRMDPKDFLFPLVERWPTVSRTAETLLVTRDGDKVVFLTELRHRPGNPLDFRLSVSLEELPAARAVRGEEGVVEGYDYRGVPVLAALRKVADMPWFMVAKIDQDEVYQPIWTQAVFIGLVSLFMVSVGVGLLFLLSRRQRESDRLASEERLRVSQEIAAVGTWDWDLGTNRQVWSDELYRLFGLVPGEIEPNHDELIKRIHAEDVQRVKSSIAAALSRGEDFQVEHRILRRTGERRYVLEQGQVYRDATGQPVRMIGVVWDTTERIRSQREYQSIIRAALDGFWLTDMRGRFLEVNESYCSLIGFSRDELLKMSIADVEAVENPEDTARHIHRIVETGYGRFETRHRHKDGGFIDLEVSAKFLDIEEGRLFVFLRDIGPRKQFEKDLIIARDAAEKANRAKSAFLANMSHEIRTPMNAILGFSQLLMRDRSLTQEQREHVESLSFAGEHLLALINDILEMSRIEAGRLELRLASIAAADLFRHLESMFAGRARSKGVTFLIEGEELLPRWIRCDDGKLRQVLVNLLGNAFKFTVSGHVTLRIVPCHLSGQGTFEEGLCRFEVQDSGPGLSPEDLSLLFKPFSQTRVGIEAKGGTGLGLAISNEYVRLMGGRLQVESSVGNGSRFWFEIPLETSEDGAAVKSQPGRVIGLEPGQRRLRILNVDDEAMNREILRKMLEIIPCEMEEASDGEAALRLYDAWQPDLILMDLAMPRLGGEETIRVIRQRPGNEKTVIIALTAMAFEEDRRRILDAGANEYLRKPFREADLFEAIARHLGLRLQYAEPDQKTGSASKVLEPGNLPDELRARIAKASVDLDPDLLAELFVLVATHDPEMARELSGCLQRYDFEAIQRWAVGDRPST